MKSLESWNWRGWVLPVFLLAVWQLATAQHWVNTKLIVPPIGVLTTGLKQVTQTDFYVGIVLSLGRDIGGFVAGALAGVALGVVVGVSSLADRVLSPTFHAARQISLFAWLPLLSALAGTGELSRVIFIAFSVLYPVALGTIEGVRSVSTGHREVARVYGFTHWQLLRRLILPSAAPQILGSLRLALIIAWMATIGAEFLLVNDTTGLGEIVFKGRRAFDVELILFGLLIIGLIGGSAGQLASRLETHWLRWRAPIR